MDPVSNGHHTPEEHTYEVYPPGASEYSYIEVTADVHLYDLLNDSFGVDLDTIIHPDPSDVLVATAAWSIDDEDSAQVLRWLEQSKSLPDGWLTPWRSGESAIPSEVWIDDTAHNPPSGSDAIGTNSQRKISIVARLENKYIPDRTLRVSLDAAVNRFQDLRRSLQMEWASHLAKQPVPATYSWLMAMDPDEA